MENDHREHQGWNYHRPLTASEKIGREVQRRVGRLEERLRRQEWQRKQPSYKGPKERQK